MAAVQALKRKDEANEPTSPVVRFGPDKPLRLDSGVRLALPDRLPDLWRARTPTAATPSCLPCADRRPARRHTQPGDRQARLVGGAWSAPASRSTPTAIFVICSNVIGGCMGSTGPASTNPATGKPYGLDFPVITVADMVRAQAMLIERSASRRLFCGARRLDGRHAGAAMGGDLSRARVRARCRSPRRPPFGPEHRLPRGRPPGDHGRSGLARRRAMSRPARAREKGLAVARMAAHITYLSESGAAAQVRPQPAGPRRPDLRLRRRLPDRKLSAPPGHRASSTASTPTPTSTSPGRWTISTSPPSMAAAGQGLPRHQDAVLRRLLHLRLAVPDRREPADRACPERRRRRASPSSRSRPTRAMTPSCSTSRSCSPRCAASSTPRRARHAALAGA